MTMMVSPARYSGGGGGGVPFTATASPTSVFGARNTGGTVSVTTEIADAVAAGDTGPFTYAWTKVSGDASWSPVNANLASTRFSRASVGPGESYVATFRCAVTDRFGVTVNTNTVEANVENLGGYTFGGYL